MDGNPSPRNTRQIKTQKHMMKEHTNTINTLIKQKIINQKYVVDHKSISDWGALVAMCEKMRNSQVQQHIEESSWPMHVVNNKK